MLKKNMEEYWEKLPEIQEKLIEKIKKDPWRLTYHLMPVTGWMNDPNGSVQFNGTYHLYHQYVPETPKGGATHWGHKTSKDLVHFKEEEIFMSPDKEFDQDGVYSGCAIVVDNKIHFFYTGNVKNPGDHDYTFSGREQNTVHVVSPDGFTIESRKVVIPHEDYPKGYTDHIRDPKVFEHDGVYYMILGARARTNMGSILLYESHDLDNWSFIGNLLKGDEEEGYMWECPDFFDLADKSILVFSPQGILPTAYNFHNPFSAGFLIGEMDWKIKEFKPEKEFMELDHGFDFYAPQSFEDESGRRILWAWMGIGNSDPEYNNPTIARGWQHAMAIPRVLNLEEGKLKQRPVPEYKVLRKNQQVCAIEDLKDDTLKGEIYELLIELSKNVTEFNLDLRQDTSLTYKDGLLTLRHGESGYGRRKRMIKLDKLSQLQIFSDTSSLELFVNDGDYVMTSRVYPKANQDKINLKANGNGQVTFWEIKMD